MGMGMTGAGTVGDGDNLSPCSCLLITDHTGLDVSARPGPVRPVSSY